MPTTRTPWCFANWPARLRLADFREADIGGQPRHAEHAQRGRDRRLGGIELDASGAVDGAVELPAIAAGDKIALAKPGMARGRDASGDAALDNVADLGRLGIGTHAADPSAHIRVKPQVDALHQDLAIP